MPCRLWRTGRAAPLEPGTPKLRAGRSCLPYSSVIVTNDHCMFWEKRQFGSQYHPKLRQHMAEICSNNVCSCFLWHEDKENKRKESPGVPPSSQLTKRKDWPLQAGASMAMISPFPLQVWTRVMWQKHIWVSFHRRNCRDKFLLQLFFFFFFWQGWGMPQTTC